MDNTIDLPKVKIGFYDNASDTPTYDDAVSCPVCHEPVDNTQREVVTILIHCTRWPLCTFLRLHKDEINIVAEVRYHEIIVQALFERARIEEERRVKLPDVFKDVFS